MSGDNMHFGVLNTPTNAAMASTVRQRIVKDIAHIRATNAFWWLSGLGIFVMLTGLGAGMAAYGYSYVTDQRAAGGALAKAIAEALRSTTLKTEGTVKVEDGGTVKLNEGGTVTMAENATVKLDRNATVKLDPSSTMPRPTQQQLAPDTRPPSEAKPVTNYTVFKTVKWLEGEIITGWNFTSSEDQAPDSQFCYYATKAGENTSTRFEIGKNGVAFPTKFPFDQAAAFSNCTWYNGGRKL